MARIDIQDTGWASMLPDRKPVAKRAAARDSRPDPVLALPGATWAADVRAEQATYEERLRAFKQAIQVEQLKTNPELRSVSAQRRPGVRGYLWVALVR
jgi:hypothetical protein